MGPDPLQESTEIKLSILLVDDDAMVREATSWMLSDAGHRVTEASDGMDALNHLLDDGPPDLLITDINMPHMDGLELASQARQRWPDIPILLVSGRPQPPGTQAFVAKPFGWNRLMQAVAQVVQSQGSHRS